MTQKKQREINLPLILPISLLVVTIVVVIFLNIANVEYPGYLNIIFVLFAFYLIFQIYRYYSYELGFKLALKNLDAANDLAKMGKELEAIKKWKSILLQLPKEDFISVLGKMKAVYKNLDMPAGITQVQKIQDNFSEYLVISKGKKEFSDDERKIIQDLGKELKTLVDNLADEKPRP